MTTPQKHTPTPWRATGMLHGRGLKCRLVAQDGTTVGQAVTPEVAAFIVLAVNNHEALLALVEQGTRIFGGHSGKPDDPKTGIEIEQGYNMSTKTTYHPITRAIPSEQSISAFLHCKLCLDEWKSNEAINTQLSPREYTNYEAGWTELGLQIWCKRHEVNICHVDFQGLRLPANTGRNA